MNIKKELELFLSSKLISETIKFETLEYYYDDNLIVFKDRVLNFMWHAWLASRNREGYVLVPVDTLNRTVGHIAIALCHPNNSKNEEDVMHKDLEIIEKAMIGACNDH